ncbi:alpha/beta fold hydrolase [Natrialba asiatica]|uniref:Alpha/beta fold family hydrolase n=1 Tax=Natrialba asiatica (strain ATCC 700177 / DSM 12278 / JCM 9576 / FERM P-10747 / NBRC 102637 / 172P1) TaxID=29540 RepID=M0ARZ1_NATA1|nr:alpha/beta fold hydrolase [Natrialba asiatica]ELZ00144.1 alpha/beta fold family hydrolase [Natrialba asiatica DSM 12278]
MKPRTVLGAAIGTVGAAIVGNRLLASRAGDLENPFTGVERTYRWRGIETTYTVAGDPNDPDMLLCHGVHAGASSHEFSEIFERLAEDYHVYAVDLPGFGRSERPPLVYSPTLYIEFLRDFVSDVTDEPIVVASSLTGSFAVGAARESDIAELVLICPTDDTGTARPRVRALFRAPVVGTALFNLLASRPSIRYFYDRDGYYDSERIDEETVNYAWRSAHQPGARYAPASFAAGMLDPGVDTDTDTDTDIDTGAGAGDDTGTSDGSDTADTTAEPDATTAEPDATADEFDLATELAALETPTTLIWGRDAELVPLREGRDLAEAADLDLVAIDYATQLPHAEHPDEFVAYLTAELLEGNTGDAGVGFGENA